jgi:N-methylhydantoinase A
VQLNSRFFDRERAAATMSALVKECVADLAAQGHTDIVVARSVEMRYLGQNHELEIPTDVEAFTEADVQRLLNAFHELHEARFGFRLSDHTEIVNFLVTGIARTGQLGFPEIASAKVAATPVSRRPVWFAEGWIDTPVYARADLLHGHSVFGPALVEESASVTVLDPGKTLTVDRYGNLLLASVT